MGCYRRPGALSEQGAAFALGPLQGLGELFAEAGFFFRRRRSPLTIVAFNVLTREYGDRARDLIERETATKP
jgi:hypothetical protein